jgi:hypothetical protein
MNLEKRVGQLEQRMGASNDFLLMIISLIGCDPEKIGPERPIYREVTGYSASGRDRTWPRRPGESEQELKGRVEEELRAEGHRVYLVCECYSDEPARRPRKES